MLNIAIVDDEVVFLNIIEKEICKILFNFKLDYKICRYDSGENFINNSKEICFNLVFMDIEMHILDGLMTSKILYEKCPLSKVVYITSHLKCMKDAFGFNVIGFVDKHDIENDLKPLLEKVIHNTICDKSFIFKTIDGECFYSMSQIACFQLINRKLLLYTNTQTIQQLGFRKLEDLKDLIDDNLFIKINRSCIVNVMHIQKIEKNNVFLKGVKNSVVISRGRRKIVEEFMINYLAGKKIW